jgi:Protein of unknown function (DUF1588)/Protein of unknown function (DUF1592)/Protein of unknown function (DUF1595)/Protein of unknown function (DUF1585)/Protein of unknown function (DUF1587)
MRAILALSAGALAGLFTAQSPAPAAPAPQPALASVPSFAPARQVTAMRRLTEAQYRNAIADIFGPDIVVAGRFEPIVRPVHELIAHGARDSSLSPAGFEQFDAMARGIAGQVFGEANRTRFVPCAPAAADKPDSACAGKALAPLGRYLFRRPLTAVEQALYLRIANEAAPATGSFHKGLELALAAMLVSPNFLYVIETAEPDPAKPGAMRLDGWSRASRLSFMLWNTTPGEAMLRAVERGALTEPAQLSAIAARMVQSPRFEGGVRAFFADMLLFEKFDEIAKDPLIYPYFNQDVAKAMPEQMLRMVVDHLVVRGGDYRGLFTTPRTFINRPLAALYRVPMTRSAGWAPFEFDAGDDRAGLLGQAGFLALYSHSGRSSPTLRGRAIRELLMCQPVPNPPGNVNFTAVQDTANKAMPTARVRLDAHVSDPVCAGCHKITDPVGLSLERFDGIGAFRATENDAPIDVAAVMDGSPFSGATGLGKALASGPDASLCVSSRALEYAMAANPEQVSPLVEAVEKDFAAGGYQIRKLFLRVATMPEAWAVEARPLDSGAARISLAN